MPLNVRFEVLTHTGADVKEALSNCIIETVRETRTPSGVEFSRGVAVPRVRFLPDKSICDPSQSGYLKCWQIRCDGTLYSDIDASVHELVSITKFILGRIGPHEVVSWLYEITPR
jgi:hypothetical protein